MKKKEIYNVDIRAEKGRITYKEIAGELGVHLETVKYWFNKGPMREDWEIRTREAIRNIREQKEKERQQN